MKVVRELPQEVWNAFVMEHPQGNIFHSPEMFAVWTLTKGYTPELWAAVENDTIAALFIPVHISLAGGLLKRLTTRTVVFGGVLCADGDFGEEGLRAIFGRYQQYARKVSLFTEVRNLFDAGHMAYVLTGSGFTFEEHLNYLISLQGGSEAVFSRIGSRTRQHIRRGMRNGRVQVGEVCEREQVLACYELLKKTYGRAKVPLADISLFHAAFDVLKPQGMARFALARVGDEPAAVSVELLYKDRVFGWYGGVDRRFMASVPNELLMWDVLEWSCRHGYAVYDFGGAGKPDEKYGVRDFKAKFGGELVCYGRNVWQVNPRLLAVSRLSYNLLRRLLFKN